MALTQNMWVVITTKQQTMHISCLQGSNYLEPKFPIDIIHLPDSCEAITDTFTLPAHSRLIKEVRPGCLGWQQYKFELKYSKIQDFTLMKEIKSKDITEKQLVTALNAVPHVSQLPVQDLTAQLTEITHILPLHNARISQDNINRDSNNCLHHNYSNMHGTQEKGCWYNCLSNLLYLKI